MSIILVHSRCPGSCVCSDYVRIPWWDQTRAKKRASQFRSPCIGYTGMEEFSGWPHFSPESSLRMTLIVFVSFIKSRRWEHAFILEVIRILHGIICKIMFLSVGKNRFFSASVLTLGILFLQVSFASVFTFIFIPFISPTFYFPYFSFSTTQLVDFLFLFYSIKTLIVSGIFYCCYLPVSRRETKIKSSLFHFKHELGSLMGILCNDSAVSSQTEPYRTSTKWPQCSLENTKSKIHVSFFGDCVRNKRKYIL